MGVNSMILVSILEGRNFPVRNDRLLTVEARFDGQVMSTEIVPHVMFPNFNTELGWEVDKKGLQMHRLQRTPIKLQCYAVDKDQTRKESIGYIVLDLRTAQENIQDPKWSPLLNCKYHRERPELLLCLFLEKEPLPPQSNVVNSAQTPKPFNGTGTYTVSDFQNLRKNGSGIPVSHRTEKTPDTAPSPVQSPVQKLEATFIPELTIYRIGPPNLCNEKFQFSVMVGFAANLNKLAPPAALRTSKDFYFCYHIFKNMVRTGRFSSLSNPDFLAERASVFISSSANILSKYFKQHPHLEVLLFCGDMPLAAGQIPVGPLSTVNEHNINDEPLCIEGSVQVYPIERPNLIPEDLSPFVGVTVILQKVQDNVDAFESPKPINSVHKSSKALSDVSSHSNHSTTAQQPSTITQNVEEMNGNGPSYSDRSHNRFNQNHTRTSSTTTSRCVTPQAYNAGYASQNSSHNATPKSPPKSSIAGDRIPMSRNLNGHTDTLPNDNVPHYFCFSLDLCNFRAIHIELPISLFIRYSYAFFGNSSAICTDPMDVLPCADVKIPEGFCQFKFATVLSSLKSTFQESPLILEVIQRKKQGSNRQERQIGISKINLFQVIDAVSIPQVIGKKHSTKRLCNCRALVISPEGREIAEIQAILQLDDFGPTTNLCDRVSSRTKNSFFPQLRSSVSSFDVPSMRPNGFSQDDLLQAALEIEVWKERQKEMFRSELKDKEAHHLKVLIAEWKQRDMERETMLQKRLLECQKLEDKLTQMLQNADIKEKQIAAQEAELTMQLQNFGRQQEQERESNMQLQKMKSDYNELVRMERLTALGSEEKINSLKRKLQEKEAELAEQKRMNDSLKLQVDKHPNVELKTEVNILRMEKNELQQKYDMAVSSKQRYKSLWGESIKRINMLHEKLHLLETLEFTKKEQEILKKDTELSFLRHLVGTESNETSIKTPPSEVKEHFNDEQSVQSDDKDESPSSQSAADVSSSVPSHSFTERDIEEPSSELSMRAQDLIAQRDKLLESQIYSEDDDIIQKLTLHIERAKISSA